MMEQLLSQLEKSKLNSSDSSKHQTLFLFDLDGTLIDTEPVHFEAYKLLLRKRGLELDWSFESYCLTSHSTSSTGVRDRLLAQYPSLTSNEESWKDLYAEKKRNHMELLEQQGELPLLPGVAEFLSSISSNNKNKYGDNTTQFIVTQSPRMAMSVIWHRHALLQATFPDFEWNVLTQEDYARPKPAPDGYLAAIERFFTQEKAREATELTIVGFEDTPRGFEALKTALHQWQQANEARASICHCYLLFMNCHQIGYPRDTVDKIMTPLNDRQHIIECTTGWSTLIAQMSE